jgi:hypothetical protein
VESPESASLVLYNTCSIREKAAQKVFSRLGEFRVKQNEGRIIGVLGCVAQQEGEDIFERAPWVSLVCGSASYWKLPELLAQVEAGNQRVTGLDTDTDETFETEMTRRDNPWRAYLTIIEGCDKACSYCVVPYTRGPERSRASDAILREARQLAELGYSEVQLLGQTVNSYKDPTASGMRFSELLLAVADEPGIRRVRFTTSHPSDFTRDIVDAIDAQTKLCNHVHLPVQSGSTRVLRATQREAADQHYHGHHRGLSWRDRRRPPGNAELAGCSTVRQHVFVQVFAEAPHAVAGDERRHPGRGEGPEAGCATGKTARDSDKKAFGVRGEDVRNPREWKVAPRKPVVGTYFVSSRHKFLFPRASASGKVRAGSGDGSDAELFGGGAGSLGRKSCACNARARGHFDGTD